MDGAADDAGALEVLDVSEAAEVAALVVAEAVEAVDGVAVLEDRDPATVELLKGERERIGIGLFFVSFFSSRRNNVTPVSAAVHRRGLSPPFHSKKQKKEGATRLRRRRPIDRRNFNHLISQLSSVAMPPR